MFHAASNNRFESLALLARTPLLGREFCYRKIRPE